jgi:hypothetical protein
VDRRRVFSPQEEEVSTRRTIRRAREQLDKLEAFAGLIDAVTRPPEEDKGVIELEEVAPGVYASGPPRRHGLGGLLDQVERFDERVREIRKGGRP